MSKSDISIAIYELISHSLQSGSITVKIARIHAWAYLGIEINQHITAKRRFLDALWKSCN